MMMGGMLWLLVIFWMESFSSVSGVMVITPTVMVTSIPVSVTPWATLVLTVMALAVVVGVLLLVLALLTPLPAAPIAIWRWGPSLEAGGGGVGLPGEAGGETRDPLLSFSAVVTSGRSS